MPDHKKSLPTYACVLLAALFFAGGIYALNEISLYTPDSTRYLVWAQSLASGDGYRDVTTPDPTRYVVHAPLYALGLAPVAWFAPGSILAAKTATLVTGVLLLLLAFGWFSHSVGRRIALLGCLVLALNPLLFLYSTEVLSDVPFAVSLVLSWVLIEKICAAPGFRPGAAIAAACSVAAALLLREIGVSVLLSALAYLLLRRRYREAVILFAIPAVLYAGWYIRNELLVAPLEDPPLTNAKIFTYHFMTGREASLVQEFSARIANNVGIYARFVGDLLFAPVQYSMQYDVIPSSDPLMASMMWALGFLRYPLALFGIASALAGVRADLRRSSSALLRISFLVFYGAVMLTYPINDIRFLLPMLLLLVYYCLVWWHSIGEEGGARLFPRAKPIIVAIVLACLVPNLSWDVVFARTSARSMQGAGAGMAEEQTDPAAPAHFTKAFRNAGSWIAAHADSDAVIMTQWKDLALWAGGRKVLNVDQTLSLDEFESQLRDYRVAILVSQVKKSGLTEFLIPMHQSRRYAFPLLQRLGNTEIYGVSARPVGARDLPADASSFERGLTSLERGEYHSADSTLSGLWFDNRQNVAALYMLAVSKACAMELGASDSLFRLLHLSAGGHLPHPGFHARAAPCGARDARRDATGCGARRTDRRDRDGLLERWSPVSVAGAHWRSAEGRFCVDRCDGVRLSFCVQRRGPRGGERTLVAVRAGCSAASPRPSLQNDPRDERLDPSCRAGTSAWRASRPSRPSIPCHRSSRRKYRSSPPGARGRGR